MRTFLLLALVVPATAHAETETYPLLGLPLTFGDHETTADSAFSWGLRPELVASRIDRGAARGWGIGGYAQLERANGTSLLAAGATIVAYANGRAIAPSAGVYRRGDDDDGVQLGLFVGHRAPLGDLPADFPLGVRLDLQLGDEPSLVVSAVLDTAPLALVIGGMFVSAAAGRD